MSSKTDTAGQKRSPRSREEQAMEKEFSLPRLGDSLKRLLKT
jgi:hypothetical protein